jgi:hypothetical protein
MAPYATVRTLALKEMARYARHPLFLVGLALAALPSVLGPDERTSSIFHAVAPAAGLGLFGLLVPAALTRSSDRAPTVAGSPVVALRTRTLALATASLVPFAVELLWYAWAVWAYQTDPPPPDGLPFGPVGDAWVYSVLFALGPMACLGGPVLGLVLARWVRARWAPALAVVGLVFATIVMRDRDGDRRQLAIALGVTLCAAAVCTVLAMTTGVEQTLVNPVPSST